MATLEQLQQAFIAADDAGNTEDAQAFANEIAKMRAGQPAEAQQPQEAMPTEQTGMPVPLATGETVIVPNEPYTPPVQEEPTLGQKIRGVGETALTMATGATGGTAGMMYGTLKQLADEIASGQYGTQDAARRVQEEAMKYAGELTYQPRTETGQEYAQEVGEALAPMAAVAPFGQELATIGQAAKATARMPQIRVPLTKAADIAKREAGLVSETGQAAKQVAGMAKTGEVPPTGIIPTEKPIVDLSKAAETLRFDPYNVENAGVRLIGNKAVKDALGNEAMKQGFRPGVVSSIKASTPKDKYNMLKMLSILKRGRQNEKYRASNRPTDVVGKSLQDRVDFVFKTKNEAGKAVKEAANNLKGKDVDFSDSINRFLQDLSDSDVNVVPSEKGGFQVDLSGSIFEGNDAVGNLFNKVLGRLSRTETPDGYRVHTAKNFLDEQVNYAKGKAGDLGKAERIIKALRHNLNEDLREFSPEYKSANDKYSSAIGALDDFQKSVGTKLNLESENADKALGTASRRLLSNTQSRVNMMDAIDKLNQFSEKYGIKSNDDIMNQIMFANELDRMFGPSAETSLAAEVSKGTQTGVDLMRKGLKETVLEKTVKGLEGLRGINEENAIKSIESLIKRDLTKGKSK